MTSIYRAANALSENDKALLNRHHNKAAGEIVKTLVKGVIDLGGTEGDALVLVESIAVGVLLTMHPAGDRARIAILKDHVGKRLAEQRQAAKKRASN